MMTDKRPFFLRCLLAACYTFGSYNLRRNYIYIIPPKAVASASV